MASPTTQHDDTRRHEPSDHRASVAPIVGPPYRIRDLDRAGKVVVALLVVLLAVPWAHSIWSARDQGFRLTGDHALISLRAHDVFSSDAPLIGQPSTADLYSETNRPAHPGPIEFYFLSVPQRLLGPENGAFLGATSFSLGAVLTAAWVIFRRGGPAVGLLGALVVSSIAFAEGPAVLYDILSSNVGGIPLIGLAALAWAVFDGDVRLLPFAALSFSFVAQQHLAIFGMALGMGVWIVVGLARYLLRWRWRDRLPAAGPGAGDPRAATASTATADAPGGVWARWTWSAWLARTIGVPGRPTEPPGRWIVGAVGVGVVAWLPVLIDAATDRGGNLRKIFGFGGESERATLGLGAGVTQVLRSLGLPPLVTRSGLGGIDMRADLGALTAVSGIVVIGLLVAVSCVWWRRRPAVATLALTTLALAAVGVVNGSQVPDSYEATRINFYRWMYVVSALAWLALLWAAAVVVAGRWVAVRTLPRRLVAVVTVAAVALMAVLSSAGRDPVGPRDERFIAVARAAASAVPDSIEGDGQRILLLADSMGASLGLAPVLALDLERSGHHVLVPPDEASAYGEHRVLRPGDDLDLTLVVTGGSNDVPDGIGTEVFRGDMNADRRAAIDALAVQAAGQPVELSPDAEQILRREGFDDRAGGMMLMGFSRLPDDPQRVLSAPAALRLIDAGLLVSPRFDAADLARARALPDPHTLWDDDVYTVRMLTPEQTAEAHPELVGAS